MVNKIQKYQNVSSLNGPIEQFIESIVTCLREYSGNVCMSLVDDMPLPSCIPQCLVGNYCGPPTSTDQPLSSCTAKQKLFLGFSAGIIAKVLQKYK